MSKCTIEYFYKVVDEDGEYMFHTKSIVGMKDGALPTQEMLDNESQMGNAIADLMDVKPEQVIAISSEEYEELEAECDDDECCEDCANCNNPCS